MAAETSRPGASADSYVGSLISLTSKSEMRYEGILYNINTDESSIGLRNVRSFGTEGRKKDGPQVPPSDKVYEYILFRGSDIKDLQVKTSPQVQPTPTINNDPAIIQSHYPQPVSTSSNMLPVVTGSLTDLNPHTTQLGQTGSNFQGALPLYQPGGNLGSWGPSPPPPSASGNGLAMPMYWPGYYGPPNGLPPHLHQQALFRPPPGLSMPPSMQQPVQYQGFNASLSSGISNFPDYVSSPVPPINSSLNLASTSLPASNLASTMLPPSNLVYAPAPVPPVILSPETLPSSRLPTATVSGNMPSVSLSRTSSQDVNVVSSLTSTKPISNSSPALPYPTVSHSISSIVADNTSQLENPISTPSLITPGQLLQSESVVVPSAQTSQSASHKDVEVVQGSSSSAKQPTPVLKEPQSPPILPLPEQVSHASQKLNGAPYRGRANYRGRERGRGSWSSRPVTKFTEEFDFMAMNEKFNKNEVWGTLGKHNSHLKEDGDENGSGEDDEQDEYYAALVKPEVKPLYNKDDFFDSISSGAVGGEQYNGRPRFSEQMKLDTETFGDFSPYRGGRGYGRGQRSHGGYYGRGGGYGYNGRGRGPSRGRGMSNHAL
ncbi:protein decapping 5-like [Impatiens glandulifera]|uniref:protein decapping 5-like n=1 Tax=Impatiens glandulifera TaxID=253017 RepID=UPI001FB16B1A|nr:protein decapping 5-like [Impatiens glandulifera]